MQCKAAIKNARQSCYSKLMPYLSFAEDVHHSEPVLVQQAGIEGALRLPAWKLVDNHVLATDTMTTREDVQKKG